MEPKWLIIIEPGDFRVESPEDYQLVIQELAVVQEKESEKLGERVMAIYKTLGS